MIGKELGRYLIIETLGEGGMAAVYKGFDRRLNRDVAIKVILPGFSHSSAFLKRFEREARSIAQLTHTNIVGVIDYGAEEGIPYLVMEFIPGGTLKDQLGAPIPWQQAAQKLIPVARALEYAHQKGIIHRDIKPANFLVTQSGDLMVSDFGIAKTLDAEDVTKLTGTGVGIGTPAYMAPEQGLGKNIDQRVDIYGLGIVLYEMITGRTPFQADTPLAVMLKHVSDPLPRLRTFVPDLSQEVEKVLFKALAKDPEERYPNMGEFAKALEKLVHRREEKILALPVEKTNLPVLEKKQLPVPEKKVKEQPSEKVSLETVEVVSKADRIRTLKIPRGWLWGLAGVFMIGILSAILIYSSRGNHQKTVFTPTQAIAQEMVAVISQSPTPEVSPTSNPTNTPIPIFTDTPRADNFPSPTLVYAIVNASEEAGGVIVRSEPAGSIVTTILNGTLVELLSGSPKNVGGLGWLHIQIPGGSEGWVLESLLLAAVPSPTPKSVSLPDRITDDFGVPMVLIPAGTFKMGSLGGDWDEIPVHTVTLDAFYMDQFEVTNQQYAACVDARICEEHNASELRATSFAQSPVRFVSWYDAQAYCEWRGARLPTDAEWEKSARGGLEEKLYPWGDETPTCDSGATNGARFYDCGDSPLPVGSFGPNGYGLYDMAGNVWEWVADWWAADYYENSPSSNPPGPENGTAKVNRGGSWALRSGYMHVFNRSDREPIDQGWDDLGFRCAADVPQTAMGRTPSQPISRENVDKVTEISQINLQEYPNSTRRLFFSNDGKLLIASGNANSQTVVIAVDTGAIISVLDHNINTVSQDGTLVFTYDYNIWDTQTGTILHHIDPMVYSHFEFSPNNEVLVEYGYYDNSIIRLWEVRTGNLLFTLQGHKDGINGLKFSPDSKTLVSVGSEKDVSVRFWDVGSGKSLGLIQEAIATDPHNSNLSNPVYRQDGKYLAYSYWTSSNSSWVTRVVDSQTSETIYTLSGGNLGFSPSGEYIVTSNRSGSVLSIFKADSGVLIYKIDSDIRQIAFTSNSDMIISFDSEGVLHFWDSENGSQLFEIKTEKDSINNLTISPDGSMMATGGSDGLIRFWGIQDSSQP